MDNVTTRYNKEYNHKYYETHKQEILERSKKWITNNKERHLYLCRKSQRKWRNNNKDKHRQYNIQWIENNRLRFKHLICKGNRKRRDLINKSDGFHTLEQWISRVEYYGWLCAYCSIELTEKSLIKDHAIAISRNGSNWASNLRPSCKNCNNRKGSKSLQEFMLYKQFKTGKQEIKL